MSGSTDNTASKFREAFINAAALSVVAAGALGLAGQLSPAIVSRIGELGSFVQMAPLGEMTLEKLTQKLIQKTLAAKPLTDEQRDAATAYLTPLVMAAYDKEQGGRAMRKAVKNLIAGAEFQELLLEHSEAGREAQAKRRGADVATVVAQGSTATSFAPSTARFRKRSPVPA